MVNALRTATLWGLALAFACAPTVNENQFACNTLHPCPANFECFSGRCCTTALACGLDVGVPDGHAVDGPVADADAGDSELVQDAGDDAGLASPAAMYVDAVVERAAVKCACTFEADGYPTIESCTGTTSFSPAARECVISAAAIRPAADALFTCWAAAARDQTACLLAAACDETASDACMVAPCSSNAAESGAAIETLGQASVTCLAGTPGNACPDSIAAAGAQGAAVFSGSTAGGGNDRSQGCSADAPDRAHVWVAPFAGEWVIDTLGSNYDTVLALYDDCDATVELACNDDGAWGARSSQLTITMIESQSILIVVDGFTRGSAGDYVVNINPATSR